jgi:hypothetical protein
MRPVLSLLAGALIAVAALVGAGSAFGALGSRELATMVLPREALGAGLGAFTVDDESGVTTNAEEAADSPEPDDTAASLARRGRLTGYTLGYEAPNMLASLARGRGLGEIQTEVALFTDPAAASRYVVTQLAQLRSYVGRPFVPGATLVSAKTARAPGLGRGAVAVRAVATFGRTRIFGSIVGFRVGRVVGSVEVTRADATDSVPRALGVARALRARIAAVLAGRSVGPPVTLPRSAAVTPPAGTPDLASMALVLRDLPASTTLEHQRYVDPNDAVAAYERQFALRNPVGKSQVPFLTTTVQYWPSPAVASTRVKLLGAVPEAVLEQQLRTSFGPGSEALGQLRAKRLRVSGVGDEAAGFRVSIERLGFDVVLLDVRVGRVIDELVILGPSNHLDTADALALARRMAERTRDAQSSG